MRSIIPVLSYLMISSHASWQTVELRQNEKTLESNKAPDRHQLPKISRAYYLAPPIPPRFEPDKRCSADKLEPQRGVIRGLRPSGMMWMLEPERAEALEFARKKDVKEIDQCPLILMDMAMVRSPIR